MTLQEILNAHKGYIERTYNDWRRTRWLGAVIAKVFGGNDVSPSEIMPLPGDDDAPTFSNEIEKIKAYREAVKKE